MIAPRDAKHLTARADHASTTAKAALVLTEINVMLCTTHTCPAKKVITRASWPACTRRSTPFGFGCVPIGGILPSPLCP